jgi:uncharacterized protein YjbI with pentapeptide repeats
MLVEPESFELRYERHQDWLRRGEGIARHRLELRAGRDYSAVDFRDRILNRVWFHGVSFPGTDLSGSILQNCYFNECDLSGADLSWTDLRQAVLIHCNLAGADFEGAAGQGLKMVGVDFQGADLSSVDFGSALARGVLVDRETIFAGARLPQGLEGLTLREMAQRGAIFK